MRIRAIILALSTTFVVFSATVADLWAAAIPILDPGFALYIANTLTPVPDNRIIFYNPSGSGSGPFEDYDVLDVNTFAPAPEGGGKGDVPAGWTATGHRPGNIHNTNRVRLDAGFDDPSGTVAGLLSVDDPDTEPPRFSQTLAGVSALPNSLYTATIQISDLDIANRGPFMPPDDNLVLGNKEMIILSLSAGGTDLGGVLAWSNITPGGAFNPDGTSISGGKSLLTLTALTGASVPVGDLTISITSNGQSEPLHGFSPSAQTYIDNVTLDVTPFALPGVAGDYNNNGIVDAADYAVWRNNNGTNNTLNNDPLGGTIGVNQYNQWKANFGKTPGVGSGSSLASAVPEPAGLMTLLVGGLITLLSRGVGSRRG